MQIHLQPSALNALALTNAAGATGTTSTSTSGAANNTTSTVLSGTDPLANENTFLQLMVAQLKNQDPLQPTDGAQFLGQLAQFSQLEQLMGIRQDLESKAPASPTGTGATGTTAS
jgi:flagellar basal-body rod modification protein FlgD